jgi:hypothetical protein
VLHEVSIRHRYDERYWQEYVTVHVDSLCIPPTNYADFNIGMTNNTPTQLDVQGQNRHCLVV